MLAILFSLVSATAGLLQITKTPSGVIQCGNAYTVEWNYDAEANSFLSAAADKRLIVQVRRSIPLDTDDVEFQLGVVNFPTKSLTFYLPSPVPMHWFRKVPTSANDVVHEFYLEVRAAADSAVTSYSDSLFAASPPMFQVWCCPKGFIGCACTRNEDCDFLDSRAGCLGDVCTALPTSSCPKGTRGCKCETPSLPKIFPTCTTGRCNVGSVLGVSLGRVNYNNDYSCQEMDGRELEKCRPAGDPLGRCDPYLTCVSPLAEIDVCVSCLAGEHNCMCAGTQGGIGGSCLFGPCDATGVCLGGEAPPTIAPDTIQRSTDAGIGPTLTNGGANVTNATSAIGATSTIGATLPTDAKGCPTLPEAVNLALGCALKPKSWQVNCGGAGMKDVLQAPSEGPVAFLHALNLKVTRCPTPSLTIDANFTVAFDLPFAASQALMNAKVMLPNGPQLFNVTKTLMQGGELELPIVPQNGIFEFTVGQKRRVGAALVIKSISVSGASVSFGVALRVCTATTMCIDSDVLSQVMLGSVEAKALCCLDASLLCPSEFAMCGVVPPTPGSTTIFTAASTTLSTPALLLVATLFIAILY